MNSLADHFVSTRQYIGQWAPIYYEPVSLSGERITIGIAALGADKVARVHQTLRNDILHCLYGEQAERIAEMIQWVCASVQQHLDTHHRFEGWQSPLHGGFMAKARPARSQDLGGIIRQGIQLCASLSNIYLGAEQRIECDAEQQQLWATQVRAEITARRPDYKAFFNKKIHLTNRRKKISYSFVKNEYIANFAALPVSNITATNTVRARIMDLENLLLDHFSGFTRMEIIVGTSYDPADLSLPAKTKNTLLDTLEDLRHDAARRNIEIFTTSSPAEAAQHILQQAA